jgi:hypothetical protein
MLRLRISGTVPLFLPYVFLAFTGTFLGLLDPEVKGTIIPCNAGICLPVSTT